MDFGARLRSLGKRTAMGHAGTLTITARGVFVIWQRAGTYDDGRIPVLDSLYAA
jgi:hypothetical protein